MSFLVLSYCLLIFAIALQNALGAERYWWSTVNLYLPQVVWAIPAPFLVFAVWLCRPRRRWLVLLPLVPALWVLGPLMGFTRFLAPAPAELGGHHELRVLTYNVDGGRLSGGRLISALREQQPQLLLFQESGTEQEQALRTSFPQWNVVSTGELLVATPLPLSSIQNVALPQLREDRWKRPSYTRCVVRVGETDVVVINVHLSTPRPAFEAIIGERRQILLGRGSKGMMELESNTERRLAQAQAVALAVAKEKGPVVVAGDFNAPLPSLICRKLQDVGLREAFQVAGSGYGYTTGHEMRFGEPFIRVDHVFVSPQIQVQACQIGQVRLSDHLPLIADLLLP